MPGSPSAFLISPYHHPLPSSSFSSWRINFIKISQIKDPSVQSIWRTIHYAFLSWQQSAWKVSLAIMHTQCPSVLHQRSIHQTFVFCLVRSVSLYLSCPSFGLLGRMRQSGRGMSFISSNFPFSQDRFVGRFHTRRLNAHSDLPLLHLELHRSWTWYLMVEQLNQQWNLGLWCFLLFFTLESRMLPIEGTSKVKLLSLLTDMKSEAWSQKGTGCNRIWLKHHGKEMCKAGYKSHYRWFFKQGFLLGTISEA